MAKASEIQTRQFGYLWNAFPDPNRNSFEDFSTPDSYPSLMRDRVGDLAKDAKRVNSLCSNGELKKGVREALEALSQKKGDENVTTPGQITSKKFFQEVIKRKSQVDFGDAWVDKVVLAFRKRVEKMVIPMREAVEVFKEVNGILSA